MPPKIKYSKEQIIDTAIEIVRKNGIENLSARTIANNLNSSPQPIFSYFKNMEELKNTIYTYAYKLYEQYNIDFIKCGKYPEYKSYGMAYVSFAKNEKEFFKLLFMSDKTENREIDISEVIKVIMKTLDMTEDTANKFHFEIWTFVHGIASMHITNSLNLTEEEISVMITDVYEGLKFRFKEK